MSTSEKFCLKWNDFQKNVTTTFGSLRTEADFVDVTLACEDGQQVEAHKVVLAASSPFFQNLLRRSKHTHPLIYMRGVKSDDLLAIVDFIYHGETNIEQENLDAFLIIAEELKLKGLTGADKGSTEDENYIDPMEPVVQPKQFNESKITSMKTAPTDQQIESYSDYTDEENISDNKTLMLTKMVFSGDLQDLDEKIKSMWVLNKKGGQNIYKCQVCGKEGKFNSQIRDHIEANHIEGVSHTCTLCEKKFRSRNSLRVHKYANHKTNMC